MQPHNTPWQCPPPHPAAEKLPMMTDAEIDQLAADIDKNGLQEPVVIWCDNRKEPRGTKGPFPEFLLDGRNRLEALKRIGIKDPFQATPAGSYHLGVTKVAAFKRQGSLSLADRTVKGRWEAWVNPETYVLSANVHRRHLTAEQKREAIAAFIKAAPKASNRKVARALGVSDHTVAEVRVQNAQNAQIAHQPKERAKAAIAENPNATITELATKAGVSERTVANAKHFLLGEKAPAPPEAKLEPNNPEPAPKLDIIDAEQELEKQAERFRKTVQRTFFSWAKQWAESVGGTDVMKDIVTEELRCICEEETPRVRWPWPIQAAAENSEGAPT
jgi:hypothetical protein